MHATMLRGAAAAAIVCVVAGGGWQIFSRIQVVPGSAANQNSPGIGVSHGFSSADAKRPAAGAPAAREPSRLSADGENELTQIATLSIAYVVW